MAKNHAGVRKRRPKTSSNPPPPEPTVEKPATLRRLSLADFRKQKAHLPAETVKAVERELARFRELFSPEAIEREFPPLRGLFGRMGENVERGKGSLRESLDRANRELTREEWDELMRGLARPTQTSEPVVAMPKELPVKVEPAKTSAPPRVKFRVLAEDYSLVEYEGQRIPLGRMARQAVRLLDDRRMKDWLPMRQENIIKAIHDGNDKGSDALRDLFKRDPAKRLWGTLIKNAGNGRYYLDVT